MLMRMVRRLSRAAEPDYWAPRGTVARDERASRAHWERIRAERRALGKAGEWQPRRLLPYAAMEEIRRLFATQDAHGQPQFTKTQLARSFGVSFEAVRRILQSKYRPTAERVERRTTDKTHTRVISANIEFHSD